MDPGIYADIAPEQYFGGPEVSKSKLVEFEKAPAKARHGEKAETPAMAKGSLLHCAVLEPDALETRYHVTDLKVFDSRHKAYQEELKQAGNRQMVKRPDYEEALRMRDGLHSQRIARELLAPGLATEQSVYWVDPDTGLRCRCRPDGAREDMQALVDIKRTGDASRFSFERIFWRLRYHWQDAMYSDGWELAGGWPVKGFVFLAFEAEPPYLVAAYETPRDALEAGRDDVRRLMARWAECERSGIWGGYPDTLQTLEAPHWVLDRPAGAA